MLKVHIHYLVVMNVHLLNDFIRRTGATIIQVIPSNGLTFYDQQSICPMLNPIKYFAFLKLFKRRKNGPNCRYSEKNSFFQEKYNSSKNLQKTRKSKVYSREWIDLQQQI